ncbi:MAG: LysM peptidoglycan-binding domain-containing protein [Micrococcales bacterium]
MTDSGETQRTNKPGLVVGALLTTPIAIISATAGADPALALPVAPDSEVAASSLLEISSGSSTISAGSQALHTVQPGETVAAIAAAHGLGVKALLGLNQLSDSALLFPGQVLRLVGDTTEPSVISKMVGPTQHEVSEGETLHAIANHYNVKLSNLLALNELSPQSILFPGQVLQLREVTPIARTMKSATRINEHAVIEGETLTSIARHHKVSLTALLKANKLSRTSLIFVGQILDIPEVKSAPATTSENFGNTIGQPTSVCLFHGFHKIQQGETISRLAAKYGLTQQSLLTANRLTWNSTVFIGQKLVIPSAHAALDCPSLTVLSDEMSANAKQIIDIGRSLDVPDYGIVIALATAMQESSLRNVAFGDRDSVGLFQQRPSAHWGTKQQIMNVDYATAAFFGGASSPTRGVARGLLDIHGWQNLPLTEAAQAVQISAHPAAYAKWEPSAWKWLMQLDSLEDS